MHAVGLPLGHTFIYLTTFVFRILPPPPALSAPTFSPKGEFALLPGRFSRFSRINIKGIGAYDNVCNKFIRSAGFEPDDTAYRRQRDVALNQETLSREGEGWLS